MSVIKCIFFIGAQALGASCSILVLRSIPVFADIDYVVRKGKDVTTWSVFLMEFLMTFNLVYVIFATAFQSTGGDKPRVVKMGDRSLVGQNLTIYTAAPETKTGFAPIAIGFTLGFLSFVGSTVSGGAYNPARVFAGNINQGDWTDASVYYGAEFLGGGAGALLQLLFANYHVFKTKQEQQSNSDIVDEESRAGQAVPLRSTVTV